MEEREAAFMVQKGIGSDPLSSKILARGRLSIWSEEEFPQICYIMVPCGGSVDTGEPGFVSFVAKPGGRVRATNPTFSFEYIARNLSYS